MANYCSDCTYLNPNKLKDNKEGCCYCSKINKYVLGNQERCSEFEEAYARSNSYKEEINFGSISSCIDLIAKKYKDSNLITMYLDRLDNEVTYPKTDIETHFFRVEEHLINLLNK